MRKVSRDCRKTLQLRVLVLIIGEPGTGRRSLARVIHKLSARLENRFMILADNEEEGKKDSVDVNAVMKPIAKGNVGTLYIEEVANLSFRCFFESDAQEKSSRFQLVHDNPSPGHAGNRRR
jgi:transcriptional regulator of aromatic amino acid metabolism